MYKVMKKTEQGLVSAIVSGGYCTLYVPGVWVQPKVGRIFVFDRIVQAKLFITMACPTIFDYELWTCQVKDPWDAPCVSPMTDDYSLSRFWDDFYTNRNYLDMWPKNAWDGIFLAESICLTQRIQEYPAQ